jgi:hypothetical protein
MNNKINEEQFTEWLNTKWKGGIHCPVCKENDWSIQDFVSEMREFNQGNFVVGGPIIPLASITCNNCAHTMHFNALKAGLIENKNPEKKETDGGK